jgi:hypothetical protein
VRQQFSSGVRQRELLSVANVLCTIIETLPLPTRSEKRSYPLLLRWFEVHWALIEPWLPLFSLRDEHGKIINFERERMETMTRRP